MAIRCIAREQIDKAIQEIGDPKPDSEETMKLLLGMIVSRQSAFRRTICGHGLS